jgi:IS1 family transposase
MNKLSLQKRAQILGMLVEGNSLRSITRMTGCSINTVTKLLVDVGQACSDYQHKTLVNLPFKRIEVDEIWAFCYAKKKNVETAKTPAEGAGDIWTWTAICADTKLIPSWQVGNRDAEAAKLFIDDLASRLKSKVQLTSDGLKSYLEAIEDAFGRDIDYSMLVKTYGEDKSPEKRYSPSHYTGAKKTIISGDPDMKKVSTSYVERQNLTMRMSIRRFTRLTNAFSKKAENHAHAVSLHFMYYNFGRIHKTLRVTPAMEAGVTNHVWSLEEIALLADNATEKD